MKKQIKLTQEAYACSGSFIIPHGCDSSDKRFDGFEMFALDGANFDGDWYEAAAEDADGNEYTVIWRVSHEYDIDNGDESDACDWENPLYVIDNATHTDVCNDVIVE